MIKNSKIDQLRAGSDKGSSKDYLKIDQLRAGSDKGSSKDYLKIDQLRAGSDKGSSKDYLKVDQLRAGSDKGSSKDYLNKNIVQNKKKLSDFLSVGNRVKENSMANEITEIEEQIANSKTSLTN